MKLLRWQVRLAIGTTAAFFEGLEESAHCLVKALDRLWWLVA